ncbi:hypothetical protein AVEN_268604-1 [Araneus ventricosus]|uniref:Uncharacterized protein n=1 Tax=Araneus ventricosus TaxID=182803 RepID=A0A4Y2H053_ARAVE|nr:hypothetical protein AVEN_268604-1 [Araneus ventricosus]
MYFNFSSALLLAAAAETSKQRNEPEICIVNPEKGDEIKQDEAIKDMPQEEKPLKAKISNTDDLTEVVSTSNVCRFTPGMELPFRHVKRPVVLLPPLAEELINEVCGTDIIEANVFKQLVLTDGRLKAEIIKFSYSYLDDLSRLLKLLKMVVKRCSADKKYSCLRGPFTCKVKRIHSLLYNFGKQK